MKKGISIEFYKPPTLPAMDDIQERVEAAKKQYVQHQEFRQEALDLACKELEVPTAQKITEDQAKVLGYNERSRS